MPSLKAFGAGGMRWIQLCCDMGLVCWREIDAGFYGMAFVFSQIQVRIQHSMRVFVFLVIAKISQIFLIKKFTLKKKNQVYSKRMTKNFQKRKHYTIHK